MLETIKEQIKSTLENFYQLKYEQEIGIVVEATSLDDFVNRA